MPDLWTTLPSVTKIIGVAADHGRFESTEYLVGMLRAAQYEVVDFGDEQHKPDGDYPDLVVPLARPFARGGADRGAAICGSGVGASLAANKVPGVRACLIHESFSAHQGVEDDEINVVGLGSRVVANIFSWELGRTFLEARFRDAERHRRRLAKVSALGGMETRI